MSSWKAIENAGCLTRSTPFGDSSPVCMNHQSQTKLEREFREREAKPYVQHHPLLGYCYRPGVDLESPRPGGGYYRLRTNSDGIRSDREYTHKKPAGVRRIIACGDSMSAGLYLSNSDRFSEVLERRVAGLEVINLSLEGSGTDQQLLQYEQVGMHYEHDIVVVFPFLQNIRRNMVEARESIDAATGNRILRGKPRYELVDGRLVLKNVPVPKEAPLREDSSVVTDSRRGLKQRLKSVVSALPGANALKKAVYALYPWEPFPEYKDPNSEAWRLMAAILRKFKELAGSSPLIIVPTFYSNYVRMRMARNYWVRFASMEQVPGIHVIDLLPYFRSAGLDAARYFLEPYDMHFSAQGHLVIADALQHELKARRLLDLP